MSEVLAGGQAPEPRPRPGWGPSCAADIMSSVAAGPLERALEHDGDEDHGAAHNSHNPQLFFRFCSSPCFSPVVMARDIQLRWTFSFKQRHKVLSKICRTDDDVLRD